MQVFEGMSPTILTIGPGHTLRDGGRLDVRAPAWAPLS